MSVQIRLDEVLGLHHFRVSKYRLSKNTLISRFGSLAGERAAHWLIPCTHTTNPPATDADIAKLHDGLRPGLPDQLDKLLRVSNGAELFRLHYHPGERDFSYWIPRYRVLGSADLVKANQELLDIYLSYVDCDDRPIQQMELNYVAFCEVGDGNFLAVAAEEPHTGRVFFLDHDYACYPFGDESTTDAYTIVADSIVGWLHQLAQSEGEDATGGRWIPT